MLELAEADVEKAPSCLFWYEQRHGTRLLPLFPPPNFLTMNDIPCFSSLRRSLRFSGFLLFEQFSRNLEPASY